MNPLFWLSFAPKSIKSFWLGHTVSQYPFPPPHSGILFPLMTKPWLGLFLFVGLVFMLAPSYRVPWLTGISFQVVSLGMMHFHH